MNYHSFHELRASTVPLQGTAVPLLGLTTPLLWIPVPSLVLSVPLLGLPAVVTLPKDGCTESVIISQQFVHGCYLLLPLNASRFTEPMGSVTTLGVASAYTLALTSAAVDGPSRPRRYETKPAT